MSLYVLSSAAIALMFISLMTPQVHAQASPLTEDQDGDGDPLNEEAEIRASCWVDHSLATSFGLPFEPELSEDDCDFAMHYLSGQCEEQTTKGANVMEVCNKTLSDYLKSRDLLTKDFPTDTERFNEILDELKQKEDLKAQEKASEEANKPSWAKGLDK